MSESVKPARVDRTSSKTYEDVCRERDALLAERDDAEARASKWHSAWLKQADRAEAERGALREALTWIADRSEDEAYDRAGSCENPGHVENHQDGPEWFCPDCGSSWWSTGGDGEPEEYVVRGVARHALAAWRAATGEGA